MVRRRLRPPWSRACSSQFTSVSPGRGGRRGLVPPARHVQRVVPGNFPFDDEQESDLRYVERVPNQRLMISSTTLATSPRCSAAVPLDRHLGSDPFRRDDRRERCGVDPEPLIDRGSDEPAGKPGADASTKLERDTPKVSSAVALRTRSKGQSHDHAIAWN